MAKRGWYFFIRACVWLGLRFYFRKVVIKGIKNIPKNGPIVFTANHQNAFLDALILATTTWRFTHYLVRADVFKFSWARWWLATLNMMPIYRIRDGRSALDQNTEIFRRCNQILDRGEALLIFPEGNHGQQRRLRPLSKGFTRIVFGAMEHRASLPIFIIPVGLNYTSHQSAGSSVSIYFGKPIDPAIYYDPLLIQKSAKQLREKVADGMRQLITHVEKVENYERTIDRLHQTNPDYLDPVDTNQRLETIDQQEKKTGVPKTNKFNFFFKLVHYIIMLNNLIPFGLWYSVKSKINDPVFIASLKFCTGLVLVPFGYILQTSLVYFIVGGAGAMAYGVFCLASLRLRNSIQID